jgi:hypothetical protein
LLSIFSRRLPFDSSTFGMVLQWLDNPSLQDASGGWLVDVLRSHQALGRGMPTLDKLYMPLNLFPQNFLQRPLFKIYLRSLRSCAFDVLGSTTLPAYESPVSKQRRQISRPSRVLTRMSSAPFAQRSCDSHLNV